MHQDTHATRQLHYHLQYGPLCGKASASAASLHHHYAPVTDDLAAA